MKKALLLFAGCILISLLVFAQPATIICSIKSIVIQRDNRVALPDIICKPFTHVSGNIYQYKAGEYTFTYDRVLGNLTVSPGLFVTGNLTYCSAAK